MDMATVKELIAEVDEIFHILDRIDKIIDEDQCIFESGVWNFYNRRVDCVREGVLRLKKLFQDEGGINE